MTRIRASAIVDPVEGESTRFLVTVTSPDIGFPRRVFTLTAKDDTAAAMDGIARYVEEMERRAQEN